MSGARPSESLPALFLERASRAPDSVACRWPQGGSWAAMTWRESLEEVASLARGLHDAGLRTGSTVGIVSETRREWTAVDMAVLALGGVVVGVYPNLPAARLAWPLRHAGASLAVVEDERQAARLRELREDLPELARVVTIDGSPGLEAIRGPVDLDWFRERCAAVRHDQLATIVYTSGTTGEPKGVALTHANFLDIAAASREALPVRPGERSLVFLPLAHGLQRFAVYRGMLDELEPWFAESIERLPAAIAACRPHVLLTVPRMLEKVRSRVEAGAAGRGPAARAMMRLAFAAGTRRSRLLESGRRPGPALSLQLALADRVVFAPIRARLGGCLRLVVSGGAALDPELARWFHAMGIEVLEGWGLTETTAPATVNRPGRARFGTVGPPLRGVELRIAADGEVLVRGPGIFQGYFRDPQATAEALRDGWFHTGDIGSLDPDGSLRILDRKKDLIVTAGGRNLAPVPIEKAIEQSPVVSQAIVLGSERPYPVALLVADGEVVRSWARRHGLPNLPLRELLDRPRVRARFAEAVKNANRGLPRFERIERYAVLAEPFTVESGELTPTLKPVRREILRRRAEEVEALYRRP